MKQACPFKHVISLTTPGEISAAHDAGYIIQENPDEVGGLAFVPCIAACAAFNPCGPDGGAWCKLQGGFPLGGRP